MHSKKFLVAILSLVMVCAFGLFFVACDDDNANEIKSVTLNQNEAALEVGQTLTLTASIDPVTATGYTISWSSDAESVAVVAEGVIRAVASGAATITAKVGEVSATCKVTVTDPSEVSTVEELTSKIEETGVAKLMADMTYSGETFPLNEKDTVIDLNGHTLTVNTEVSTTLSGNRSLTIRGGELVLTQEDDYYGTRGVFAPETGAVVTVEDVVFTTNGTAFFPRGDAAAVSVIDSEIYAPVYCVGTNASGSENFNVVITLRNSKFVTTGYTGSVSEGDKDDCPVMINVPGKLFMDGCTVSGNRQAVVVRGGTAVIENSTIRSSCAFSGNDYMNSVWGSGNNLALAVLVVGNRHATSYQYSASCTLKNTTVSSDKTDAVLVYAYGNADASIGATLVYDSAVADDTVVYGGGYVTINGVVQE